MEISKLFVELISKSNNLRNAFNNIQQQLLLDYGPFSIEPDGLVLLSKTPEKLLF